ncbi:MAG: cell surface protein [Opitutaceae bacterium]|nr:cell surface protein [Opitutaceae bacterium]
MHKTTFLHASRIFLTTFALIGLMLLTGCEMTIIDLTPDKMPQNPSQIYTLTARFKPSSSAISMPSIQPRIVIDGQSFMMAKSSVGEDVWEFDYQLPAGRLNASYYYICDYTASNASGKLQQQAFSELKTLTINNRYVRPLEVTRAPVGARVNVLGYGLTPQDVVCFDNTAARTVYESPASLSFFVPSINSGKSYQLVVRGPSGELGVGTFRVDSTSIQVSPSSLYLRQGEQQPLTFTIPLPAGPGGVLVEVTTDIPESVIMPEVIVPAGSSSVSVSIQGGKPGQGSIYFKSNGAGEISVPITVAAK